MMETDLAQTAVAVQAVHHHASSQTVGAAGKQGLYMVREESSWGQAAGLSDISETPNDLQDVVQGLRLLSF